MIKINKRNFIRDELLKLNYSPRYLGTLYLTEVIDFISNQENYIEYLKSMERTTYNVIADRFNVNVETLKSDIRKACIKASKVKTRGRKAVKSFAPKNITCYVLEKIPKI